MNDRGYKLLLIVVAILWGSGFVASQFALDAGWDPFVMLSVRGFIGGGVLMILSLRYKIEWYKNKRLWALLVLGGVLMFGGFALQLYGQKMTSISMASIFVGLYVLLTPIIASFFKRSYITIKLIIACIIAFFAIFIVSYDGGSLSFGWGELILFFSSLVFAMHFLVIESLASHKIAFVASGVQLLVMGILAMIMSFVTTGGYSLQLSGFDSVVYLALFCSALAFVLQTYGQERVNSTVASIIVSSESIFGVLGAVVVYGDQFSWNIAIGCFLMFLALAIMELKVNIKLF